MTKRNGLEECYAAFERLKKGNPRLKKFHGISPDRITASCVSQEAGFDNGYLKKKRVSHQGIIALIETHRTQSKSTTLSKAEVIRREKQKTARLKERLDMVENLLEQALARELLLVTKLAEMEKALKLMD